jgi:hypothetical protein
MTIQNDFLAFATGGGANVLSQDDYAALSAVLTGYQSGVASSAALNKTWRQSSLMANVLAQLIVAKTGQPVIDDGTTATLLSNLASAMSVGSYAVDVGAVNAYAITLNPAPSEYLDGMVFGMRATHANTDASTINVNGLGPIGISGSTGALQGGEIVAQGNYLFRFNAVAGTAVIIGQGGGALQVSAAIKSQQAVQLGQFGASLSSIGYVKIPNPNGPPLIIEWFPISNVGSTTTTGTFPLAFPNNCFAALLTGLQGSGGAQAYAVLNSKTLSAYTWNGFTAPSGSAPYLAPGSGAVQGFGLAIGI